MEKDVHPAIVTKVKKEAPLCGASHKWTLYL